MSFSQTTYYVDDTAPREGADGATWQTAFQTIQAAHAAARDGDVIWVAAGDYSNPSKAAAGYYVNGVVLEIKKSLSLYGGFPDGGGYNRNADMSDRRPLTHRTRIHVGETNRAMLIAIKAPDVTLDGFELSDDGQTPNTKAPYRYFDYGDSGVGNTLPTQPSSRRNRLRYLHYQVQADDLGPQFDGSLPGVWRHSVPESAVPLDDPDEVYLSESLGNLGGTGMRQIKPYTAELAGGGPIQNDHGVVATSYGPYIDPPRAPFIGLHIRASAREETDEEAKKKNSLGTTTISRCVIVKNVPLRRLLSNPNNVERGVPRGVGPDDNPGIMRHLMRYAGGTLIGRISTEAGWLNPSDGESHVRIIQCVFYKPVIGSDNAFFAGQQRIGEANLENLISVPGDGRPGGGPSFKKDQNGDYKSSPSEVLKIESGNFYHGQLREEDLHGVGYYLKPFRVVDAGVFNEASLIRAEFRGSLTVTNNFFYNIQHVRSYEDRPIPPGRAEDFAATHVIISAGRSFSGVFTETIRDLSAGLTGSLVAPGNILIPVFMVTVESSIGDKFGDRKYPSFQHLKPGRIHEHDLDVVIDNNVFIVDPIPGASAHSLIFKGFDPTRHRLRGERDVQRSLSFRNNAYDPRFLDDSEIHHFQGGISSDNHQTRVSTWTFENSFEATDLSGEDRSDLFELTRETYLLDILRDGGREPASPDPADYYWVMNNVYGKRDIGGRRQWATPIDIGPRVLTGTNLDLRYEPFSDPQKEINLRKGSSVAFEIRSASGGFSNDYDYKLVLNPPRSRHSKETFLRKEFDLNIDGEGNLGVNLSEGEFGVTRSGVYDEVYLEASAGGDVKGRALLEGVHAFLPSVIYVDVEASGVGTSGTGKSWEEAYAELQKAFDRALPGDEIWVAEGTYFLDQSAGSIGDPKEYFTLHVPAVSVYGGFFPGEKKRDGNDKVVYEDGEVVYDKLPDTDKNNRTGGLTILSGGSSGTGARGTFADANASIHRNHVLEIGSGLGRDTRIDNITFVRSSTASVLLSNSSPTFTRCRFYSRAAVVDHSSSSTSSDGPLFVYSHLVSDFASGEISLIETSAESIYVFVHCVLSVGRGALDDERWEKGSIFSQAPHGVSFVNSVVMASDLGVDRENIVASRLSGPPSGEGEVLFRNSFVYQGMEQFTSDWEEDRRRTHMVFVQDGDALGV
ncbi:MAG: hypothetical protein OXB93_06280, partial [Cytophagales bacterium]|nr:hypothetical protein [Cytophagales bacterium]